MRDHGDYYRPVLGVRHSHSIPAPPANRFLLGSEPPRCNEQSPCGLIKFCSMALHGHVAAMRHKGHNLGYKPSLTYSQALAHVGPR